MIGKSWNKFVSALLLVALFSLASVPAFAFEAEAGKNVQFTASADGTQPFTYAWKKDGVSIPSATSAVLLLTAVTPASAGTYSVTISNSAGQVVASEVFTLTVVKPSNPKITGSIVP
jgi:type III secretory pathway component EscU